MTIKDHIYILNYIGSQISYYRGIWIIEFINLFATICIIYKIARLKCNRIFSIIVMLFSTSMLFFNFQGGNLVEEYAMPLIAASLYIFLDYFTNKKINIKRLVICGMCFGGVLLLRPNMISTWIVFCIAVFFQCVKEKSYRELCTFVMYFTIGIAVVFIPTILWLGINGALVDFWKDYIEFNRVYSSAEGERATIANKFTSLVHFSNNITIIISLIIIIYMSIKDRAIIFKIYLIYIVVSLFLICISGMQYEHYGMVLVPVVTFPVTILYEISKSDKEGSRINVIHLIITMYILSEIILPNWVELIETIPIVYEQRNENKISNTVMEISQIIEQKSEEDDKISVYGNWNIIYVISKRKHASKYSYQFPIGIVQPNIMEEYIQELEEETPKIIVIESGKKDDNIMNFINNNNYLLIWQECKEDQNSACIYAIDE